MKSRLIGAAFAISLLPAAAHAQVTVDMGALTCEQYLVNVAIDVARLLRLDERLVQLSDPQESCGCACAPEKYRKREIVVPIPSAGKRDGRLAERDWPAVTFWSAGEMP